MFLLAAVTCVWVLVSAVSPAFTPVSAELTNAHGFSRGLLNLVVLPGDQPFRGVSGVAILIAATALLPLAMVRPVSKVHPIVAGAAVVAMGILVAVALAPLVTPYRVVLAPRTFVLCVGLVMARRLLAIVPAPPPRWMPLLTGAVSAAFFASAALQTAATYGGNYSGFLHLSRDLAAEAPYLRERPELVQSLITYEAGYDGQFMYFMAFDPLLRRFADRPAEYGSFIDSPPYRYGRIGFSALTTLVSFGRAEWYPAAMIWLTVAAHFALGTLLAYVATSHGMSPLTALLYVAIPGFMSSLMSALPEALAAAGLVAGYLSWEWRKPLGLALAFAAALLVRETGIVLLVALGLTFDPRRGTRMRALILAGALAPVCLWRLFVASRLFGEFGWAALLTNPGDLGVPLAGLADLWAAVLAGTQPTSETAGGFVFPIVLTAALTVAVSLWRVRRGPLETAAVAYALVAVSLNYEKIWTHVPSGERGTFELFVCLLLLLLTSVGRPAWVRTTLVALFGSLVGYTFFVAPDAATSRAALGLIR